MENLITRAQVWHKRIPWHEFETVLHAADSAALGRFYSDHINAGLSLLRALSMRAGDGAHAVKLMMGAKGALVKALEEVRAAAEVMIDRFCRLPRASPSGC